MLHCSVYLQKPAVLCQVCCLSQFWLKTQLTCKQSVFSFKVARCSFSGPVPPKFEHKLRRHKQSFGKIANTVVLDEDENLL